MFTMEITRLIERCRQGDADALGELYKAYAHRMRGVCRRYVSDEQTVDDVLHDAFVIIFTSFDRLRDASKAEPWMMSITRNVASKYKERMKGVTMVPIEEAAMVSQHTEQADVKEAPLEEVLRLIDKLPEGYGKVFRLSVFEGLSHKEIAAMLGIEAHSSSSQLARAKKMLRKMMQQYWAVFLLLIIPVSFFLLKKDKPIIKEEKTIAEKQKEELKNSPTELPKEEPVIVHLPVRHTTFHVVTQHPVFIQAIDSIMPDTLSNMMAQEQTIPDSVATDSISTIQKIETPHHDIADLFPDKSVIRPHNKQNWSIELAYAGGMGEQNTSRPYGFTGMQITDITSTSPSPVTFDNWNDYAAYLSELPDDGTSHTRSIVMNIALNNANQPGNDKILRNSHHSMPITWSLAIRYRLNNRFGLESGLSYSRLTSDFEMGSNGNTINEQQTIHYLGIPVKGIYNIYSKRGWNLYGNLGVTTEIPVYSSLSTNYYLHGVLEATEKTTFRAPWQWSVGTGLGLQYNLTPDIGLFAEPSLQYYIPTGSNVETYRTEHPFTFSMPLGIRFTW